VEFCAHGYQVAPAPVQETFQARQSPRLSRGVGEVVQSGRDVLEEPPKVLSQGQKPVGTEGLHEPLY